MKNLFPEIEPYNSGFLKVSDIHEIYFEESGNPKGKPVVFLHGGPGGGISPTYRRYFDPEAYRIVLFDQRGSGQSKPFASLEENTTWDLVEDLEKLRAHLKIERWMVFGGSWGSTLALSYAETHPQNVTELVLRGIFLCRKEEIHWFYQFGAHHLFPDHWEDYIKPIPEEKRDNFVEAYYELLTGTDEQKMKEAAHAWSAWEARALHLLKNEETIDAMTSDAKALSLARIECHFFKNGAFMESDDQLLKNAHRLKDIPGVVVHGRYDVVTPVKNAWDLSKVWPKGELKIIPDAGHSITEPGILSALIQATEDFKEHGRS
jgi:proline iminopeptidase